MGPSTFKMGHVTQPHLIHSRFVIHKLRLATVSLCTKCESLCFHARKICKVTQNVEIVGFGVPQCHCQHNHR